MDKLSERGYTVAIIVWALISFFSVGESSCLEVGRCSQLQLWGTAAIGVGLTIPAKFITIFLGGFAPSLLDKEKQSD